MVNRMGPVGLLVGAAGLVAATTVLAVEDPLIAGVAVLALLPVFTRGVDGWRWLLALTMALLICASSNIVSLADGSFHWRFVAIGALIIWGLCLPSGPKTSIDPWTRVFLAALWAIAGLATLSVTWSVVPMETLPRGVALLLLAALVHLVVRRRWPDRDVMMADLRIIYVVLALSTVVSLGYGLIGGTLGPAISGSTRFEGVYNNPNMLGMVCALTVPLGWAAYRHSGRRGDLLGILPAAGLLVLSQSRTGLIAVLVGALWVVLRHGLGPLLRLAAVAAGALLTAYLFNLLPAVAGAVWIQQVAGRFTGQDDLSSGRTGMWQATIDLWWQNRPALGFGYASRNHLSELARYDELLDFGVGVVHNSYLQLLLELGLAAAVPLVLLLLAAGKAALRAPVSRANSGLVWLIVTGLLIQLTESAIFGTGQTYPYVFWLAVAAVLLHLPADRAARTRRLQDSRSHKPAGQPELLRLRPSSSPRATKALTRSRQAR
ncbi:O-antigen ligase family protein [Micromonospora sp. NBC_01813]|uniref:O-antigen ligase family protein n=1 Tax=Micromonospora sp. NBC_01813 TaxID=2975988 RepID=UPI002DD814A4|nr:O-antigen ligase family protein [Micromonospora sp. NBC_01813]WSA10157.1 O-antigen ligase family protein [Micromonospora sp. NBC_01813]